MKRNSGHVTFLKSFQAGMTATALWEQSFWESSLSSGCSAAGSHSLHAWESVGIQGYHHAEGGREGSHTPMFTGLPETRPFLLNKHPPSCWEPWVHCQGTWPFSHGSYGVCGGADFKAPLHSTGSASFTQGLTGTRHGPVFMLWALQQHCKHSAGR